LGGYFSINYALRHLPATVVSAVLVLQPVITAILAVRSEGEGLSALQIIGGLLVIGGVIIVKAAKKDRPKEDSFVSDPA
jgi:drug/metabolite transporter (DMT)-like permease